MRVVERAARVAERAAARVAERAAARVAESVRGGVDIESFVLEDDSLDFRDLRFSHNE